MKQRALAKLHDPNTKVRRYRPPDSLLHSSGRCDSYVKLMGTTAASFASGRARSHSHHFP
jgi:hypothetical protein